MNWSVNYSVSSSAPEFSPHFTSDRPSLFFVADRLEAPMGDSLFMRAVEALFLKYAQALQTRDSHGGVLSEEGAVRTWDTSVGMKMRSGGYRFSAPRKTLMKLSAVA
jgi:hypothetical protein